MAEFPGWSDADFDTYLEKKWRSNRFNLERMRTREKLESWVRSYLPPQWEDTWQWGTSLDHPTIFNQKAVTHQRCVITLDSARIRQTAQAAKSLGYSSAEPQPHGLDEAAPFVRFQLNAEGFAFEFGIPAAAKTDLANLAAALKDDDTFKRFAALMQTFTEPNPLALRLGEAETEEWSTWDRSLWNEALSGLLESAHSELVFSVQWSRESIQERSPEPNLQHYSAAALDWIQMFHWSQDTNFLGLSLAAVEAANAPAAPQPTPQTEEEEDSPPVSVTETEGSRESNGPVSVLGEWQRKRREEKRGKNSGPMPPENRRKREDVDGNRDDRERPDRPRMEDKRNSRGKRDRTERGKRDRKEWGKRSERRDASEKRTRSKKPRQSWTDGQNRTSRKTEKRKPVEWRESSGEIQVGTTVRVKDGLLQGKIGEVVELSGKGDAKVRVGLFPMRVKVDSLVRLEEK